MKKLLIEVLGEQWRISQLLTLVLNLLVLIALGVAFFWWFFFAPVVDHSEDGFWKGSPVLDGSDY